jgi:hypothetical protein
VVLAILRDNECTRLMANSTPQEGITNTLIHHSFFELKPKRSPVDYEAGSEPTSESEEKYPHGKRIPFLKWAVVTSHPSMVSWILILDGIAGPRIRFWQQRRIGNVTALPHLDNFPQAVDLFDECKRGVSKPDSAIQAGVKAAFPSDCVDSTAFVAIDRGDRKGVDEAVLERSEVPAEGLVEAVVEL